MQYQIVYDGFDSPTNEDVQKLIVSKTQNMNGANIIVNRSFNSTCPGSSEQPKSQGQCFYCGPAPPCATHDQSACTSALFSRGEFTCKCDRTKHFFRTNYEYDEKCGRYATVWWPQMLVLCVLIFLILLLLLGLLLLLCRRQRKLAKKYEKEPQVMSNAPQKTSDFEYVQMNNSSPFRNTDASMYSSLRRPRPIYPTGRVGNEYIYQRRPQQSFTFPSRSYPLQQRVPPTTFDYPFDGRSNILRKFDNNYNPRGDISSRINIDRDNIDDDDIFV